MSRRWRYVLFAIGAVVVAACIALYWLSQNLGPLVRSRVVHALEQRFNADIQLKSLHISLIPEAHVVAEGITIRHRGWTDQAPLIRIRRFTADTDLATILAGRNRVKYVKLEGLEIHIPPRGASAFKETFSNGEQIESGEPGRDTTHLRFTIDTIQADGTKLVIAPKTPGGNPLDFDLKKLTLHSAGPGKAMRFTAMLVNAKPPGLINTNGYFGPWQRDDPRATPVSGSYTFRNANLGVFNGISGILSSSGSYTGVLQHIETSGTTDTPDFALQGGGTVHLRTTFHALVNGTDGNTILDPVEAAFLQSKFLCRGGIIGQPGKKGKMISLQANTEDARMEDILALVVGGKPFLNGAVNFQTGFVIPPGPADIMAKLRLSGGFRVASATFTNPKIEERLVTLSDRARGISQDEEEDLKKRGLQRRVASNFRGQFRMADGRTSFSRLAFEVPGASIRLRGSYDLKSQRIDMQGVFQMKATLSETQSGIKSLLIKPFNKLFEKGKAGFSAPLKISGTRDHPVIALTVLHHQITLQ